MSIKLQDITRIQFGVSIKTASEGILPCLQVSNITLEGDIDEEQLVFVKNGLSAEEHLLGAGDLVLPAKGQKFSSAIISQNFNNGIVASSSLLVIKVSDDRVLPEYLHWYLNLSRIKWSLEAEATGTNILSLSIKALREFPIELPDLETQKKIINLNKLQKEEQIKMRQLGVARKKLIEALTKKLIE